MAQSQIIVSLMLRCDVTCLQIAVVLQVSASRSTFVWFLFRVGGASYTLATELDF
jgi:hypothetical protein